MIDSPEMQSNGEKLKISNLYKLYRGTLQIAALQGISLEISGGEVVAIEGVSGSGKSTLLQCIGGLQRPTIGEISIYSKEEKLNITFMNDRDLVNFRKKEVGFVFQDNNLFKRMSVIDNVTFPQIIAGSSWRKAKKRALKLLEDVNMLHRLKHRPYQLSGGEKQRVSIAAALANDPEILLADEPTGELDSQNTTKIMEILYKMAKRYNKAVVIVTHDHDVSMRCDRIIRLQDGQVIGQGKRDDEFLIEVDKKTHRLALPDSIVQKSGIRKFVKAIINEKGNIELIPSDFQKIHTNGENN